MARRPTTLLLLVAVGFGGGCSEVTGPDLSPDSSPRDPGGPDVTPLPVLSSGPTVQVPADAAIAAVSRDEDTLALTADGGSTLLLVDLDDLSVVVVSERVRGVPELFDLAVIRFTPEGVLLFSEGDGTGGVVHRLYASGRLWTFDAGERQLNWAALLNHEFVLELLFRGDGDAVVWAPDSDRARLIENVTSTVSTFIFPDGVHQEPGDGRFRREQSLSFALDFDLDERVPIRVISSRAPPLDLPSVNLHAWGDASDATWCGWSDDAAYRFDLKTGDLTETNGRILGGVRVGTDCATYVGVGGGTELRVIDGSNHIDSRIVASAGVVEPNFFGGGFANIASERVLDLIAVPGRQILVEGLPDDVRLFEFGRGSKVGDGIVAIRYPRFAGGNGSELWYFHPDGGFEVLRTDPPPALTADPCERFDDSPYLSLSINDTTGNPMLLCASSTRGPTFTSLALLNPLTNTTRQLEGRELRLQPPLTPIYTPSAKVWRSESKVFVLEGPNENGELDLLRFDVER